MGACFLYGNISQVTPGNVDRLNFHVYGGENAPNNPKWNDIWVKTSLAIPGTSVFFNEYISTFWLGVSNGGLYITMVASNSGLTSSTGMNCVIPGSSGNLAEFNVNLLDCQQMVNGAWVRRDAYIYHNGWVQFSSAWDGHLFNYGDTYSSVTGGWVARDIAHTTDQYGPYNAAPSVQAQSNGGVKVYMSNTGKSGIWTTANKVSLAGFNTLTFNGNLYDSHGWNRAQLDVWSDFGTYSSENVVARLNATYNAGTYTLDISSLTGSYYIGVRTDFDGYAIVNEIKLS